MGKKKSQDEIDPILTKQLKGAIEQSALSIYRIAKDSGVSQPVLQRFMSGEREDVRLSTVEKLAAYFGMKFTPPKKPPSTK